MEKTVEILLVEDNPGDVRLTLEIFKDARMRNNINTVSDGIEAMEYLRNQGKYSKAVKPDLILLDLNLPRKDGREVLSDIKSDVLLKRIPIVILTISMAEADILKSYDLHANCYITKPINLGQFIKVVTSIEDFWLAVVKLPPKGKNNE